MSIGNSGDLPHKLVFLWAVPDASLKPLGVILCVAARRSIDSYPAAVTFARAVEGELVTLTPQPESAFLDCPLNYFVHLGADLPARIIERNLGELAFGRTL